MNSRATIPLITLVAAVLAVCLLATLPARAADKKPNILVIMGDDIGWFNLSVYNRGMMGFQTLIVSRRKARCS